MSLQVNMTGNQTGFQQMLNSARTQAKGFANSITHEVTSSWGGIGKQFAGMFAGLASFEGVKRGLEWFAEKGKEIKETAEQVDMSTDSWQKWTSAVSKAGLGLSGFQRVVESLRQKRTEALTDPAARAQLNRLGFSDSEITGEMDMGEFTRRALENANGGDLKRKYLSDVISKRGLKYATATKYVAGSEAMFSDEDLKQAEELAMAFRKMNKASGTATIGLMRFFTGQQEYQRKTLGFWSAFFQKGLLLRGIAWDKDFTVSGHALERAEQGRREDYFETEYQPVKTKRTLEQAQNEKRSKELGEMFQKLSPQGQALVMQMATGFGSSSKAELDAKNAAAANPTNEEEDRKNDPLYPQLLRQQEELAMREQTRQQRFSDSKRGLMTIGDRRASIRGEIGTLSGQISARLEKLKGEGFLTEADQKELDGVSGLAREMLVNAKRAKYQDATDDLMIRKERLTGELKEKPLKFNVDSMSKVGLYSASAVAFNPLLGVAQRQLHALEKIVSNTSKTPKDSHAP